MFEIDMEESRIRVKDDNGNLREIPFFDPEAFALVSQAWLRIGWDTKYVYSFTWMGRPIIQLPEDIMRIQEVIYKIKPDVIIETGIAHGGSLVFYASLCKGINHGKVIGIDVEIRPHNRKAIEKHELFEYITLVEGDSIDRKIVNSVISMVKPGENVIVILDSNHTKQHVLNELHAYAGIVSVGSYIVACDGIMENLVRAPRSSKDWSWNNPKAAAEEFISSNDDFIIEEPEMLFNEGIITERVTYWPRAFIKRIK
ncbi:cephalosporin hydroxylase family protein [Thermodesulfobacteriota bacterium]